MSIAIYVLILTESMSFLVLFVPFCVLALAETVCKEPWHGWELPSESDQTSARMTRWHIVAAILVVGSVLIIPIRLAFDVAVGDIDSPVVTSPSDLVFSLIEVSLWLIFLAALYGPMYAVRLSVQRVHGAELIGLGLCLFPSVLLVITLFMPGTDPALPLVFGIVGVALFPFGAVMPGRWLKTVLLTSACVAMLLSLTDLASPANPVWLMAAIAMGYLVFRAESKHLYFARLANARVIAKVALTYPAQVRWVTPKLQTVVFLVVNVACALALLLTWRIESGTGESLPTAAYAFAAMSIAAMGALSTALVPMAFGRSRSEVDLAASTFVMAVAIASVLHLIATPQVEGWVNGNSQSAQLWKPVLGTFACIGAVAIALTTLTGRLRQFRPFMIAVVLPAASLLPTESFFTFRPEDSLILWTERLLETGITISLLAIMWYVFGPGRRRAPSQATGTDHRETVETATA